MPEICHALSTRHSEDVTTLFLNTPTHRHIVLSPVLLALTIKIYDPMEK